MKNVEIDVIFMPTPPITLTSFVLYVKKRTNALFYLILRDIYPQGAADLGLVKSRIMYSYLRKLEIKTYKNANLIGCMSKGNIDYLRENNDYLDYRKLKLLPNWQREYDCSSNLITIKEKYNLKNKFIVLFGGTIGYAQKVDNIILLADHYQRNSDIVFLVIGNGVMKKYLVDKVKERSIKNILFFDNLPRTEYLGFVKSADIGLITIDERFTVPTIPSKTTSYLNLKLPILAIIDPHTDYRKIIEDSEAGLWSIGGDKETLFFNFERLYNDKDFRITCGEKGYQYFKKYMTSEIAYINIISQLEALKNEHFNI